MGHVDRAHRGIARLLDGSAQAGLQSRLYGRDDVPAVRDGHIYEIKSSYILQPGPAALTEGVHQLHRIVARVAQDIADERMRA